MGTAAANRSRRIDVDVHQRLPTGFWERLPRPWSGMRLPSRPLWPAAALGHGGYRADVHTTDGARFETTPAHGVERLLDPYAIDVEILTGNAVALGIGTHPNGPFALAFAQAYNDWLIEFWLQHDPRFKGSMLIAPNDVAGSVAEIRRLGRHPDVVQVKMPASCARLYGDPALWPIYEAPAEHQRPVAVHRRVVPSSRRPLQGGRAPTSRPTA
jgi:uncharacterized protein